MTNQLNILHTKKVNNKKSSFLRMPLLMSAKRFPYTSIHFSICYLPGTLVDPGIHRQWCLIPTLKDLKLFWGRWICT